VNILHLTRDKEPSSQPKWTVLRILFAFPLFSLSIGFRWGFDKVSPIAALVSFVWHSRRPGRPLWLPHVSGSRVCKV